MYMWLGLRVIRILVLLLPFQFVMAQMPGTAPFSFWKKRSTTACSGQSCVVVGSYTGNGVSGTAITGLGFSPSAIIIKRDGANAAVFKTSSMSTNSKDLNTLVALESNLVISLDGDGFTLGSDARVNANGGGIYHWVAFKSYAGEIEVGSYVGDNTTSRDLNVTTFQPNFVAIFPDSTNKSVWRSTDLTTTMQFNGGTGANQLTALLANGFQTGSDTPWVNATGVTYHYIAIKAIAGRISIGSFTGDAVDGKAINGLGFKPAYLMLQTAAASKSMAHKSTSTGDATDSTLMVTAAANAVNNIQSLTVDGFTVGSDSRVNPSAAAVYWIGFK